MTFRAICQFHVDVIRNSFLGNSEYYEAIRIILGILRTTKKENFHGEIMIRPRIEPAPFDYEYIGLPIELIGVQSQ